MLKHYSFSNLCVVSTAGDLVVVAATGMLFTGQKVET